MTYFKVWTVGNGGIESQKGKIDVPSYLISENEEETKENIGNYLDSLLSPLPASTRSINWEPTTLTKTEIDEKLEIQKNKIETSQDKIKELNEMKKEIDV